MTQKSLTQVLMTLVILMKDLQVGFMSDEHNLYLITAHIISVFTAFTPAIHLILFMLFQADAMSVAQHPHLCGTESIF